MSCYDDCNTYCVEPGVTDIAQWSYVGINADGVAVQLTFDNMGSLVGDRSEVYMSFCAVKPETAGKERDFISDVKMNGNCINWLAMGADTPEKIAAISRLGMRKKIRVQWPHTN